MSNLNIITIYKNLNYYATKEQPTWPFLAPAPSIPAHCSLAPYLIILPQGIYRNRDKIQALSDHMYIKSTKFELIWLSQFWDTDIN